MAVNTDLSTPAYYDLPHMTLAVNPNFSDSEAFGAIAAEIAQSVAYIQCRRFGISRGQPDLSKLAERFQGWPA